MGPLATVLIGGIPEWPKGPDCKSGGNAFAGSNPAPAIVIRSPYNTDLDDDAGVAQW